MDNEMKVEVYKVGDDRKPVKLKDFTITEQKVGTAKREARAKLEAEGMIVRAISRNADSGVIIAYVLERRPDARERGKPVVHTGPVGKGRQVRRRGSRR